MRLQPFVSRRSLSLALLSVALEWGVGSPVSRGATMPRPPADTIVIRLHNYAAVPKQVLERAQAEAGRVFGQVGVEFHWVDCPTSRTNLGPYPGCLQTRGLNTIDLNLLPRRMAELANQSDRTLGLTPISKEGELVTITAVFVDLVKERASRGLASVSQLLACAIAHEIGHILLRTSGHSTTGIMRGFWTAKDLQQIAQGYLLFTPQQAQSIQKNLTKRAWTSLFGLAKPRPAKGTETNLKINVCVYNLASVPWGTLAQAEKEAGRIFERTGVQVGWLDYPLGGHEVVESSQACGPPFGAADVRLRLLTYRLTELRETHPHSLGRSQVHSQKEPKTAVEAKVIVYDYADVAPEVLAKAEKRIEAIFQELHVRVVWVDHTDFKKRFQDRSDAEKEQEELDSIDVTLRILLHSRVALKNSALGEALPCRIGKDACIANVFMNRVVEQTDVEKIGVDQVLGHAMAHEIGHILLGSNSHSSSGLMKSKWGPEDMKRAAKGDLLFTPEQAQTIRKNLTKRAWTSLFGLAKPRPAKATETNLKINVCVYNLASVPWGTLAQAEKEAGRIFEQTGVQLSWLDYPLGGHEVVETGKACGPPFGAADVRLRLLTYRLTELRETHPHSLGLALPCVEADGGCFVNVFYQRTQELAKDADLGLAKVLAPYRMRSGICS
jgi:hypothetical protein